MQAQQYEEYQAFLWQRKDGDWLGSVRHDESNVENHGEHHLGTFEDAEHASHTLRQAVSFWAGNRCLTRLPAPLPWTDDIPNGMTSLKVVVPYTPPANV